MRAGSRELEPARRRQHLAVGLVGLLRDRDAQAVAQGLRHRVLDRHIPAADEQRRDRLDLRRQPGGDAPFDAAQIGVGRRDVLLAREQQRHVDRHAGEDRLLDRRHSGRRAGDLDEQVRPLARRMQALRGFDRTGGVVDQQRRQLERRPAVDTAGRVMGRTEQVGGLAKVLQREREEERLAALSLLRQLSDRPVVRGAAADRLVEDRRVRSEPRDRELRDVARQRAVGEHVAADVVEPETLAEHVKSLGVAVHDFSWIGLRRASSTSTKSPMCSTVSSAAAGCFAISAGSNA